MARPLTVMQLLPALHSGGVERSTLEIAGALVTAGHRAIVVSAGGRLQPRLEAIGARHLTHDIGRKSPLTLRHVLTLRRLIRTLRPDIVHARSRLPAWLAWLALRTMPARRRPRFVTTVHGLNSVGRYSAIMTRGERVIAVSDTVRAFLREHYAIDDARVVVIPRGIDPQQWPRDHAAPASWRSGLDREYPQLAGRRLLLMPGRGTRLKGHGDAIALLAALSAIGHDVALLLMGAAEPGRERYIDELRAQADRAGVAGRLAITPARSDVRDAMAEAALVLQLSRKPESFGRTVIETLAVGRPVLGWRHGGVGELLDALYPVGAVTLGDADALAGRAAGLLAHAPAPPPLPARYLLARMQADTLALYRELAGVAA